MTDTDVSPQTDEARPLFGFAFREGWAEPLYDFAAIERAVETASFVWVHLDLGADASQQWLRQLPYPRDVLDAVSEPVQRGRLFAFDAVVYGHLRDLRVVKDDKHLRPGSLCILLTAKLVVSGRRIPLRAVEVLRQRIEAGAVTPSGPYALLAGFFNVLNEVTEDLIERATRRLSEIGAALLKRSGGQFRDELLEMRRDAIRLSRDMSYKRVAMRELLQDKPPMASNQELRHFRREVERYAAIVEDAHEMADHCQFLLDELRAQVAERTNRNLYVLTLFSVVFLPAGLIVGLWGMNVGNMPFSTDPYGFWEVVALIGIILASLLGVLRVLRFF
ncbi:MAG: magnesium transporter CorA family protein [Geminicoccaceae bacterium]